MANDKSKKGLHPLMWTLIALTAASVLLLLFGLIIPPTGEVHPTLLKGLSIITADIALINFAYAIVSGRTTTFRHGKTSTTVK